MHEIIADLYRAAAGTKPWGDALTSITQHLDLKACQMIGVAVERGAVMFSHVSNNVASESELEYIRVYHRIDPRIPLLLNSPFGEWIYDEDVFDPGMALSEPYYRDLLIPYGGRYSATAKLAERDGETMFVGFMSHLNDASFTEQRRQFLESIRFHLREAASIHLQVRKANTAALAGTELLHRMPRPAWLLDTDRRVTFMNEKASRYLEKNNALLLARDRLSALDKSTDDALAGAFRTIVQDIAKGGTPDRRMVRLMGGYGQACAALSLTAFVPSESMYAFGTQAQVLLLIHEPAARSAPDLLLWEATFNLTPSQSRVAQQIFMGRNTKEAARSLKIAETTLKTHLQELFRKTETSRQAQLVAALATLQAA